MNLSYSVRILKEANYLSDKFHCISPFIYKKRMGIINKLININVIFLSDNKNIFFNAFWRKKAFERLYYVCKVKRENALLGYDFLRVEKYENMMKRIKVLYDKGIIKNSFKMYNEKVKMLKKHLKRELSNFCCQFDLKICELIMKINDDFKWLV